MVLRDVLDAPVHLSERAPNILICTAARALKLARAAAPNGGSARVLLRPPRRPDQAYGYVRDAIDAFGGPVLLDVAGLSFCGAGGLGTLARMSRHAAQAGSSVRLVAPPPLLRKIIRITGLADQLPVHRSDQAGHVQVA